MQKCVIVIVPYAFIALFQSYKFGATLSCNGLERVSLEWSEIEFQKTISIECHEIQVDKFFLPKNVENVFFFSPAAATKKFIHFFRFDRWMGSIISYSFWSLQQSSISDAFCIFWLIFSTITWSVFCHSRYIAAAAASGQKEQCFLPLIALWDFN